MVHRSEPSEAKSRVLTLLLLVAIIWFSFPSGATWNVWKTLPASAWGLVKTPFRVVEEAVSVLQKNHYASPQPSKLIRGALDAIYEKVESEKGVSPIQRTEKNGITTWRIGDKVVEIPGVDSHGGGVKSFKRTFEVVRHAYYPEKKKSRELAYVAIGGMMKDLDPHSALMTPEFFKELRMETRGEFGGIGIEIMIRDGKLTVVSPIEGTPASRLGVKANDHITRIDDFDTKGISLFEAVRRMRGPKGTAVTIRVRRKNFDHIFPIIRDIIQIQTVKVKMLSGKVGYVRLRSFVESSYGDLLKAINMLEDGHARGLILDLRNNPGGLLRQAVKVSDLFLDKGSMIVYTKGKRPEHNMRFIDKRVGPYDRIPMVILVNSGSASASEIVAGALQDLHRALVIGTRTFGKGSVQTIVPLSDGSGLRVTTALYYTTKGREIQAKGILPDLIVRQPGDARSGNLVLERELLRQKGKTPPAGKSKRIKKMPSGEETQPDRRGTSSSVPVRLGSKDDYQLDVARRILDSVQDRRVSHLMIRARKILSSNGMKQARIERMGEARP